ncbi:MAG: hypothetical protein HGA19_18540 [Oscillochloris sp.]|nr:hypothetical protein [Oscillochloris sp.]
MGDTDLIRPKTGSRTTQQTVQVVDQHDNPAPTPAMRVDGPPEVHTTVKETVTVADDPQRVQLRRIRHGIFFAVNLIAILISIRIVLALLGADPGSIFATFIYTITGILTFPFQGLFGPPTPLAYGVFIFEGSSFVAIAIYYLVAWIALRIVALRDRRVATTHTEVTDRETRVEAEAS